MAQRKTTPKMHTAPCRERSRITQTRNGVLAGAAEDIRHALAILARAGAEIEGFNAAPGRPPLITIARPVARGIVAAAELVGIEHTQFGNRNRYRGMVHHVAVEWVI